MRSMIWVKVCGDLSALTRSHWLGFTERTLGYFGELYIYRYVILNKLMPFLKHYISDALTKADYLLVMGVCLTLSIANIVGFTKCQKDAKKQIKAFATQTIASRFSSTLQSAFSVI
ncbi:hypothetical protein MLD38_015611 [Melastoma candidum]|uniref:Uncharacterized protein n=1 Tax=Melastoma candidum TaxID=119954 RepID=A0ACB9RGT2_9MYRT|nr:hypothetical protein MLD38_015611 [Melastoma candidum]